MKQYDDLFFQLHGFHFKVSEENIIQTNLS
uniref:Uncharacterized protein n=1 Tax=Rhizophora mucronata TaxID=61149 RepID=A0A2P2PB15_RHIMU